MPYPSEHSCRLHDPEGYEEGSFRRVTQGDLAVIVARPTGKEKTEAQAFRYPVGKWTEKKARAHCKKEGGTFEAAKKEDKAMGFDAVEVDGVEVSVDDLIAAYRKSVSEEEQGNRGAGEQGSGEAEGKALAVKALREEDGGMVVGGHLLLWGGPEAKDLQGDYFTPETELWLEAYKAAPALFHHGLDETVGMGVIGHRVKAAPDEVGVWVEDWLDMSGRYWEFVQPLLEAEVLYYSPGSAPHLVKRAEDGRLESFPVVEDTLTVVPAQHRLRAVEQIKAAYKAAGLALPDGLEPEEPDPGGDGAGAPCVEVMKARARATALLVDVDTDLQD